MCGVSVCVWMYASVCVWMYASMCVDIFIDMKMYTNVFACFPLSLTILLAVASGDMAVADDLMRACHANYRSDMHKNGSSRHSNLASLPGMGK